MQRVMIGLSASLLIGWLVGQNAIAPEDAEDKRGGQVVVERACIGPARTQMELTACAENSAVDADKLLNRSYQTLLKYLCGDERAQLVASERAWLAFRDADCAFRGSGGGSIAPMNEAYCRADLSQKRVKELDDWPPNAPPLGFGRKLQMTVASLPRTP